MIISNKINYKYYKLNTKKTNEIIKKNYIIVLEKREGKHARDKSQHAEASPHFSKKKKIEKNK